LVASVAAVANSLTEEWILHGATFIDSVARSLSRGDFLLLVVGDGIRSGLQQIASLLQNRATLGFSFGLVEMAIYSGKGGLGPYYVQLPPL
jgi:hypothetical protein